MRPGVRAAIVLAGFGVFVFLALFLLRMSGDGARPLPAVTIGGPFELASSRGGTIDSDDLLGQPYAVFFGFTHCPEVCPTTLYEISNVLSSLGEAAKNMKILFITVDPERDTVDVMKDYLANFDPRIEGLVPTADQLPGLASDFRIYHAKSPTSDGSYTMDHTASIFLFDADGQFAGTLSYGEAPEMRAAKLRRLLH
ncbi:SCO family protein [Aestuariivirga sp.]|jgi:protein SCO1/2|uniref:SCO family protein n=1 Tax=Aestuariivirga sp. TaxID=2650926 RepID=UPI0037841DFB